MPQGILPIEFLIAAPLEAVVKAQAMAAHTTAEFVNDVGFEQDRDGTRRARMVDFEYTHPRADPNNPGEVIDTPVRVRVPLLSMISIPNVQVDEASVDLHLRVHGHQPATEQPRVSGEIKETEALRRESLATNLNLKADLQPRLLPTLQQRARLVGSVTGSQIAEQTASLKISIKIKQAVAPEGLAQILSLLGEATTARPIEGT